MAKRKPIIDLTTETIEFQSDEGSVRLIRFDPNAMSVEVNIYADGQNVRTATIAFAHLPKPVKKQLKPL